MIVLTSRHDKHVVVDESQIAAMTQHDDYTRIYLKVEHVLTVKETVEDVLEKMTDLKRRNMRRADVPLREWDTGTTPRTYTEKELREAGITTSSTKLGLDPTITFGSDTSGD